MYTDPQREIYIYNHTCQSLVNGYQYQYQYQYQYHNILYIYIYIYVHMHIPMLYLSIYLASYPSINDQMISTHQP